MKDPHLRPLTVGSAALALFCAMLWGANAVAVRFTQEDLPPLATAWIRFALSIPFLVAWFKFQGHSLRPKREEWSAIGIIGLLLFVQIGLFHYGLDHTNASIASRWRSRGLRLPATVDRVSLEGGVVDSIGRVILASPATPAH